MHEAQRAVEHVARVSYARLISYLSARSRDVASAEDALSDAFAAALRTWPEHGVPSKPESWLLHAARRRLIDRARLDRTHAANSSSLALLLGEAEDLSTTHDFPDERLKLLFVCAHPAIDARLHTPLMLQVVLGLEAADIAAAFVTPASTMGQRLSRAKAKIRDAHLAFEVPSGPELPARLFAVLEAIYAAYGFGWEWHAPDEERAASDARLPRDTLTHEALWLARTLATLMPDEPEALGLLALLCYCEARRSARRTSTGAYVPMSAQDTARWDLQLLAEADRALHRAATCNVLGRFQLEAAVQSAHVERLRGRAVSWSEIVVLYEGLVRMAPTLGAQLGRVAAVCEAQGAPAALALLDALRLEDVRAHQPYWAVRAHVLQALGDARAAHDARQKALDLTCDPAVRAFLARS